MARFPRPRAPFPLARVAGAVILMAWAVYGTARPRKPVAEVKPLEESRAVIAATCPDVDADLLTVDVSADAGSRPALRMPSSESGMPKHWRRAPCPEGASVRVVNRVCFDALKETPRGNPPTCDRGIPFDGECLQPMAEVQKVPTSVTR